MVMTNQEKIAVLKEAQNLIAFHGLAHGIFMHPDGCLCAEGAIIKALNPDKEFVCNWDLHKVTPIKEGEIFFSQAYNSKVEEVTEVLAKVMSPLNNAKFSSTIINGVNDRSTKEEVLAYFDKAIESLEKEIEL